MRSRVFFCALFAAAIVLLAAVTVVAFNPRVPDRDAIVGYNPLGERVFKGSVADKAYAIEGLLYFPLKTADATVEVQIGPKDFVERSGFKLDAGDMVTVIGLPVIMMNRHVVLTREVSSVNGVLTLRNQVGLPLWEREPVLMDPAASPKSSFTRET